MLWKKESRQPDAHYIDFFPNGIKKLERSVNSFLQNSDQKPIPVKSDTVALQKRKKGNELFSAEKLLDAIELYSDSLRYANPGSENISLAYANRATCFLDLNMYDECLADIESAMAAGYPERLRPKLQRRKEICLKEMEDDPKYPREKFSIESNEQYPYLSNVANIQRNDANGVYSVVATTDIDVGEPIVIEDPHYTYQYDRFGAMCNICLKEYCNLVPCKKCASAMFCPECQGHFLHENECGLHFGGSSAVNSGTMGVIRDVLLILNAFDDDVDELMSCVEEMLKRPKELPDNLLDDRSKFQVLFSNVTHGLHSSIDEWAGTVYPPYKTIMRIPRINEIFKSTKHQRFLMHLIGHQSCISGNVIPKEKMMPAPGMDQMAYRMKTIMQTFFQRACCPNVLQFDRNGKTIWHSVKPIKMGEQLFVKKRPADAKINMQTGISSWGQTSKCQCDRCKGKKLSSMQRKQLTADPDYRFIQKNKVCVQIEKVEPLMDACVSVLRQYGEWNWCEEIQGVISLFGQMQSKHMVCEMDNLNYGFLRAIGLKSAEQYVRAHGSKKEEERYVKVYLDDLMQMLFNNL